jgi:hypothetical protein
VVDAAEDVSAWGGLLSSVTDLTVRTTARSTVIAAVDQFRDSAWIAHAACAGRGDVFFNNDPVAQATAQRLCSSCPVRSECLAAAQAVERRGFRFGVWGGLTAVEREQLR